MELKEVKEKAGILKSEIEGLLKKFRDETGYTPRVSIETKTTPTTTTTNTFVSQKVSIDITIQ